MSGSCSYCEDDGLNNNHKIKINWIFDLIRNACTHVRMTCRKSPKTPFAMPSGDSAASQIIRNRHGWPSNPYLYKSQNSDTHKVRHAIICDVKLMNSRGEFILHQTIHPRTCQNSLNMRYGTPFLLLTCFWNVILQFRAAHINHHKILITFIRYIDNITFSNGRVKSSANPGLL